VRGSFKAESHLYMLGTSLAESYAGQKITVRVIEQRNFPVSMNLSSEFFRPTGVCNSRRDCRLKARGVSRCKTAEIDFPPFLTYLKRGWRDTKRSRFDSRAIVRNLRNSEWTRTHARNHTHTQGSSCV